MHLSRAGNLTVADHGGGTIGQISILRLVPERRFALAIVTNSGRGGTLNATVGRVAFEAYLDVAPPRYTRTSVAADVLPEYVGTYRRQYADITVTRDGGALKLAITPRMPGLDGKVAPAPPPQLVGFYAKDRLLRLDGPTAGEPAGEFVRDDGGRGAWLRSSRIHKRISAAGSTQ